MKADITVPEVTKILTNRLSLLYLQFIKTLNKFGAGLEFSYRFLHLKILYVDDHLKIQLTFLILSPWVTTGDYTRGTCSWKYGSWKGLVCLQSKDFNHHIKYIGRSRVCQAYSRLEGRRLRQAILSATCFSEVGHCPSPTTSSRRRSQCPFAYLHRRLSAGLRNFENLYKPVGDEWFLYDNPGSAPVLIEEGIKS